MHGTPGNEGMDGNGEATPGSSHSDFTPLPITHADLTAEWLA